MHATYSPEDNKLRLYADSRLSDEDYQRIKALRFKWAPKQECFVCARWTPAAEDLLLEWCGEIDDEDYSPEERAADRAERFSGYRDKRRAEASDHADTFDAGPSVHGHQSAKRAERAAKRHNHQRLNAVSQWGKAEYWQRRTAGVISNALYKSSARVRRSRILRIEADERGKAKEREQAQTRWDLWSTVRDTEDAAKATKFATALANTGWIDGKHPRTGRDASLWSLLTDPVDPITGYEAAAIYFEQVADPGDEVSHCNRWLRHYELRLTYERAMLAQEGGSAADADIEPGGFFGGYQVQRVNKSRATGRVVSVMVYAEDPYYRGEAPAPQTLQKLNIERFAEDAYRPPTDEEREAFKKARGEAKAKQKADAKANPKPKLVNPTDEDAERLQALWNMKAKERHIASDLRGEYEPAEVLRITQAKYSAYSKGNYAHLQAVLICANGCRPKTKYGRIVPEEKNPIAFKIRKSYASGGYTTTADRVIVLTDKPQNPLPLNWESIAEAQEPVSNEE